MLGSVVLGMLERQSESGQQDDVECQEEHETRYIGSATFVFSRAD